MTSPVRFAPLKSIFSENLAYSQQIRQPYGSTRIFELPAGVRSIKSSSRTHAYSPPRSGIGHNSKINCTSLRVASFGGRIALFIAKCNVATAQAVYELRQRALRSRAKFIWEMQNPRKRGVFVKFNQTSVYSLFFVYPLSRRRTLASCRIAIEQRSRIFEDFTNIRFMMSLSIRCNKRANFTRYVKSEVIPRGLTGKVLQMESFAAARRSQ